MEGEDDVFEIEKILLTAVEQDVRYYKVRWLGFDEDHDTWEPEENLFDCKDVLDAFWGKDGKTKQSKRKKRKSDGSTNLKKTKKKKRRKETRNAQLLGSVSSLDGVASLTDGNKDLSTSVTRKRGRPRKKSVAFHDGGMSEKTSLVLEEFEKKSTEESNERRTFDDITKISLENYKCDDLLSSYPISTDAEHGDKNFSFMSSPEFVPEFCDDGLMFDLRSDDEESLNGDSECYNADSVGISCEDGDLTSSTIAAPVFPLSEKPPPEELPVDERLAKRGEEVDMEEDAITIVSKQSHGEHFETTEHDVKAKKKVKSTDATSHGCKSRKILPNDATRAPKEKAIDGSFGQFHEPCNSQQYHVINNDLRSGENIASTSRVVHYDNLESLELKTPISDAERSVADYVDECMSPELKMECFILPKNNFNDVSVEDTCEAKKAAAPTEKSGTEWDLLALDFAKQECRNGGNFVANCLKTLNESQSDPGEDRAVAFEVPNVNDSVCSEVMSEKDRAEAETEKAPRLESVRNGDVGASKTFMEDKDDDKVFSEKLREINKNGHGESSRNVGEIRNERVEHLEKRQETDFGDYEHLDYVGEIRSDVTESSERHRESDAGDDERFNLARTENDCRKSFQEPQKTDVGNSKCLKNLRDIRNDEMEFSQRFQETDFGDDESYNRGETKNDYTNSLRRFQETDAGDDEDVDNLGEIRNDDVESLPEHRETDIGDDKRHNIAEEESSKVLEEIKNDRKGCLKQLGVISKSTGSADASKGDMTSVQEMQANEDVTSVQPDITSDGAPKDEHKFSGNKDGNLSTDPKSDLSSITSLRNLSSDFESSQVDGKTLSEKSRTASSPKVLAHISGLTQFASTSSFDASKEVAESNGETDIYRAVKATKDELLNRLEPTVQKMKGVGEARQLNARSETEKIASETTGAQGIPNVDSNSLRPVEKIERINSAELKKTSSKDFETVSKTTGELTSLKFTSKKMEHCDSQPRNALVAQLSTSVHDKAQKPVDSDSAALRRDEKRTSEESEITSKTTLKSNDGDKKTFFNIPFLEDFSMNIFSRNSKKASSAEIDLPRKNDVVRNEDVSREKNVVQNDDVMPKYDVARRDDVATDQDVPEKKGVCGTANEHSGTSFFGIALKPREESSTQEKPSTTSTASRHETSAVDSTLFSSSDAKPSQNNAELKDWNAVTKSTKEVGKAREDQPILSQTLSISGSEDEVEKTSTNNLKAKGVASKSTSATARCSPFVSFAHGKYKTKSPCSSSTESTLTNTASFHVNKTLIPCKEQPNQRCSSDKTRVGQPLRQPSSPFTRSVKKTVLSKNTAPFAVQQNNRFPAPKRLNHFMLRRLSAMIARNTGERPFSTAPWINYFSRSQPLLRVTAPETQRLFFPTSPITPVIHNIPLVNTFTNHLTQMANFVTLHRTLPANIPSSVDGHKAWFAKPVVAPYSAKMPLSGTFSDGLHKAVVPSMHPFRENVSYMKNKYEPLLAHRKIDKEIHGTQSKHSSAKEVSDEAKNAHCLFRNDEASSGQVIRSREGSLQESKSLWTGSFDTRYERKAIGQSCSTQSDRGSTRSGNGSIRAGCGHTQSHEKLETLNGTGQPEIDRYKTLDGMFARTSSLHVSLCPKSKYHTSLDDDDQNILSGNEVENSNNEDTLSENQMLTSDSMPSYGKPMKSEGESPVEELSNTSVENCARKRNETITNTSESNMVSTLQARGNMTNSTKQKQALSKLKKIITDSDSNVEKAALKSNISLSNEKKVDWKISKNREVEDGKEKASASGRHGISVDEKRRRIDSREEQNVLETKSLSKHSYSAGSKHVQSLRDKHVEKKEKTKKFSLYLQWTYGTKKVGQRTIESKVGRFVLNKTC
ncbi:uncharacterized protein LOC124441296 isoform X2 [Xenia sp. Carnegie-2017]|uniref:uncharacterized protein LOC124441296 isoform X2 n=1 Tax=Xenia sp. Carnegie-2017 TaxID=2897299 RepID=UPI001F04172A|nr:uncharacterized protein LOC124441296 isoform X2 [Xenia sp. Carnegie-2017]